MAVTADYTPKLFNFYLSGISDAIENGTAGTVNGLWTETAIIDGVTWTVTHEGAVQSVAGTATDTHVITSSDGFSATGVELVNNYTRTTLDTWEDWDAFDNNIDSDTWTGDFGNFVVTFSDGANGEWTDTYTGTMTTVSGDLLENVNIVLTGEDNADFPSSLDGTATLNGETVTFDSSMLTGSETATETTLDDVFGAILVPDAVWFAAEDLLNDTNVTTANGSMTFDGVVWSYSLTKNDEAVAGTFVENMSFSNELGYTAALNETSSTSDGIESASGTFTSNVGTSLTFAWSEDGNAGTWTETLNGTVGSTYTFNNFSYTENWSTGVDVLTITGGTVTDANGDVVIEAEPAFDPADLVLDPLSGFDNSSELTAALEANGLTVTGVSSIALADEAAGIDEYTISIGTVSYNGTELATNVSMNIYIDFSQIVSDIDDNYISGEAAVVHTIGVDEFTQAIDGLSTEIFTSYFADSYSPVVNTAPVVNNPIADVVLTEGDFYPSNIDPDALGWFSDADGDQLTYTFHWDGDAADDTETLSVFNSANAIETPPIGEELVTVTATDPSGASATQTFKIITNAVVEANTAPVAVGDTAIVDEDSTGNTINVLANDTMLH